MYFRINLSLLNRSLQRILKWSYPFEYYVPEDEVELQALLKHNRDSVRILLENLKRSVENELPWFQYADEPSKDFNKFCMELTRVTSATRKHNETLVKELENGLANIVPASNRSRRILNGEASVLGLNSDG